MTSGPDPAGTVAADPFWSVVRRRHPDIDIVVLQGEGHPVPVVPEGAPIEDPAGVARRRDAEAAALWQRFGGTDNAEVTTRWTSGPEGAVRREVTLRLEEVGGASAAELLERSATTLRADGWDVFVPPTGVPRVLAGRDEAIGRTQVQVLHDSAQQVVAMRIKSAAHNVGKDIASGLIGGES